MDSIDRWALGKCLLMVREVTQSYEEFKFHQIYRIVHDFCTVKMSNFYLDALKDRMYTSAPRSKKRRSSQTAFYFVLRNLVKILAPILPFTCEEVWLSYPIQRKFQSAHEADWPGGYPEQVDEQVLRDWDNLTAVRDVVNVEVEKKRMNSEIGSSLEAKVVVRTTAQPLLDVLDRHKADLALAFIVSEAELEKAPSVKTGGEAVATVNLLPEGNAVPIEVSVKKAGGKKCERCWIYSVSVGQNPEDPALCAKCVTALKEIAESG
jgi:isoleucyl-tRNA synthetase